MARKRIRIVVKDPTFGVQHYRGVGYDENGAEVDYAYETTRERARESIVRKMKSRYGSDLEIIY